MKKGKNKLKQLKEVTYYMHDMWFSLENLKYDQENQIFILPFGRKQEIYSEYLKITKVKNCEIVDTEKIGIYDICGISFDHDTHKMYIEGNIPLEIILDVADDYEIAIHFPRNNKYC